MEGKLLELTCNSLEELTDDELEYEVYIYILNKLIGEDYNKEIDLHIATKKIGTLEAFSNSYKYTELDEADSDFYENDKSISPKRIAKIRKNVEDFLLANTGN